MTFHRFETPTYFGGLPVGYDLINVVSGGTGAGGSAFADGVKGLGNPNSGTYFVAWGEDATSSNANRGLRALAQNTDLLDDLFHRELARAERTTDAVAGAPVAAVVLPVNTFIGTAGYTTSVADLGRLFSILDASDNEIIIQSTGQKVQVTSVTLGAGDTIGGGGANGSFSGNTVTINISPSIPTGTTYRIWYASRTDLATLPVDAFTTIKIRGAEEVTGAVEDLFRLLHGNNLSWNAAWTTTVYDMAASGLWDRYNRGTASAMGSPPESYWAQALDSAGSGGWLRRSGPALTMYTYADEVGGYTDPINALFAGKFVDQAPFDASGATGLVIYGARKSGSQTTGESPYEPGAASFMALWPHHYGNTVDASSPYTRIFEGATASLANVGAYNANTGEAVVTVTQAGNYFRKSGESAIACGYDMLEVTYTQSALVQRAVFVIVAHGASNDTGNVAKVRVRRLDGAIPDFSSCTSVTIRWHSLSFGVGDGAGRYHKTKYAYSDSTAILFDGLFYQVPTRLTTEAEQDDIVRVPATFSAVDVLGASPAVLWGGFQYTVPSGPVTPSSLNGDGGIYAQGQTTLAQLMAFDMPSGASGTVHGEIEIRGGVGDPGRLSFGARSRLKMPPYRILNVNTTINITETGPCIILTKPTAARTITIEQATDAAKEDGDSVTFWLPVPPDDPDSGYWVIKREGSASNIAILNGKNMPTAGAGEARPGFCRVHLEGGVWRFSGGAGCNNDTDA